MKETNQPLTPERLSELIDRAKAGDQKAFTALYEATSQEVYRTVRSMVRDEDLGLDIQQDAYVSAFTHLDQLSEPAKFPTWLRTIAANLTRNALRKRNPLLFSELEGEEGEGLPELPDLSPESSPELRLEREETAAYVREILDGLTDGQRMLVGLYYYEQRSVGAIAAELHVSPGTVKTQLYRSRKKIETAVHALEARGIQLFGLGPVAYLLALLKRTEPSAQAGKAALKCTLVKTGTLQAAQSVTLHVGRRFFETALGKLVLGLLAAGMVGGGIAGYRWYQTHLAKPMGDWQPDETLEALDSEEDLPTEPEDPWDTDAPPTDPAEPLPVTEPSKPTDPTEAPTAPTEAPTEPPTAPTQASAPTEPGTQPTSPSAEPTTPTEPVPTNPLPTDPSVPSEPTPTEEPVSGPPQIDYCGFARHGATDELYDIQWDTYDYLYVIAENGSVRITTDNPDMIRLEYEGRYYGDLMKDYPNGQGYYCIVTFLNSGTAHIYCSLNGERVKTITVYTPEYPDQLLDVDVTVSTMYGATEHHTLEVCENGSRVRIQALFQGRGKVELTTDNPAVVDLGTLRTYIGGNITHWSQEGWFSDSVIVGPGEAHIYLKLNGEVVRTWNVHAVEAEQP